MKKILLTQGKFALVDDEDFELLNQYKWRIQKDYNTFYAVRWQAKKENIIYKRKLIRMHREIMEIEMRRKLESNEHIHHINENGLDNCICNLQIVTQSEHQRLSKKYKNCTTSSQYKGVIWSKKNKIWRASICIDKKTKHLGNFKNELDAAIAYDQFVLSYFGEKFRPGLNFPNEDYK